VQNSALQRTVRVLASELQFTRKEQHVTLKKKTRFVEALTRFCLAAARLIEAISEIDF
jgi:hypothetical protein